MCPSKQDKVSLGFYRFILEKNANYRTQTKMPPGQAICFWFCPLCINTVLAIILLVTSNVATLSLTQHQRLRALIFLMFPPQKNIIFFMEHIFVDLPFPY